MDVPDTGSHQEAPDRLFVEVGDFLDKTRCLIFWKSCQALRNIERLLQIAFAARRKPRGDLLVYRVRILQDIISPGAAGDLVGVVQRDANADAMPLERAPVIPAAVVGNLGNAANP